MFKTYRELFAAPGSKMFSASGFIARMPTSMISIGLVTMLSQVRGEYGMAGAIAAVFALSSALLAPQIAKLVDQRGQSKVLLPAAIVSGLSILSLLLCVRLEAPDWTLFVFALLAGCIPSMPAMIRARWSNIYTGSPMLHTAFSFESVVDEVCFIFGPILSVSLSVSVFLEAGVLAACLFLLIGVVLFTRQKSTEPPVSALHNKKQPTVLRIPAMRVLVITFVAIGTIFGGIDVVTVAFARFHGSPVAASYILSIYAVGSCIAGLVFGLLKLKAPLHRQFLVSVAVMTATMLPLLIADTLLKLGPVAFISGLSIAPTMIVTMALIERRVPGHQLTEGMTWATAGLGVGVALGSSLAGRTVDAYGVQQGYLIAIIAGFLALAFALMGYRSLRKG